MHITDVETIVLRAPSVDTSRSDGTQDALYVRVHTDEGITGVGEADSSPYLVRTAIDMPSSHIGARGLREILVGENPLEIGRLWELMFHASEHYGRSGVALHAISAIDMALWDIAGKAYGQPVSTLLGGRRVERVKVYASELMPDTVDEVRRIAATAVERGYRALKLGWGPLGQDLAVDERLIRAAREVIGMERDLMIDGGRAYTLRGASELLARVADVRLYWLEEPLQPDDLDGYRRLADSSDVRIATGEIEAGIRPFRALVERARVDVLQPDLGHCGGFTVGRKIADLAAETDVEVVPHCFASGVLVAASLHLAAVLDRPTYSEFSVTESPLASSVITEPFVLEDGQLRVPDRPGLGIELDDDAVARYRVAS